MPGSRSSVRWFVVAAAIAAAFSSACAQAQAFPSRPLRILVPYGPGGIVDVVGRQLGQRLGESLGQSVLIENKPGAAGTIAMDALRQAPADGHTLVVMDPAIVINPIIQPKLSYNALRDMQMVSLLCSTSLILTVTPSLPVRETKELLALARSRPGFVNYSSAGIGTTPHMAGEMFRARTGVNIVHVPYKGGNAATTDLLAGQIQMTFMTPSIMLPYAKEGRLRAVASTGVRRSPSFPDVPTLAESGYPDFEVSVWLGLFVMKDTPAVAIARLNQVTNDALRREDMRAALAKFDIETIGTSTQDARVFLEREEHKWAELVRSSNIKPD